MADLVKQFQLVCPDLTEAMEKNTHHYSREKLNPYHTEGNSYAHVMMTCLATEFLKVNTCVKVAILLHDVGKPMSTRIDHEQGKIKMFGHEGISAVLGMRFLHSLDLTDAQKVRVLQLVAYHTTLYKAMREPTTFESTIVETFKGNAELLMDLLDMTACDALGRFSEGDEKRDFWMNVQNELGYLIFKCDKPVVKKVTNGEAIILVGPPNSGKSTWIKNNVPNYKVMSRDEYVLKVANTTNYDEAYKKADHGDVDSAYDLEKKQVIKTEKHIVFDLTHMTAKARRKSLNGLPKDMKKKCVVFLPTYELLVERNKKRSKEENKTISSHTLENMMGSFCFPLIAEGFDEIEYIFGK